MNVCMYILVRSYFYVSMSTTKVEDTWEHSADLLTILHLPWARMRGGNLNKHI